MRPPFKLSLMKNIVRHRSLDTGLLSINKFIFLPIRSIVVDVIGYFLKWFVIADDMVVKTGLPFKFKTQTVGVFGNGRFIGTEWR